MFYFMVSGDQSIVMGKAWWRALSLLVGASSYNIYSHSQGPRPAWLCLGAELEPSKPPVSCFHQQGPPPKCPEPSKILLSIGEKRSEHQPVGIFPVPTKVSGRLFTTSYQLRPSRERSHWAFHHHFPLSLLFGRAGPEF